jgi:dTDP-4-dehydrorhamnose reductase
VEPLSDYGRSKAAGEQAVLALPTTCVLRVSWVFGPEKPSYVDRVRSQALAGEPLAAVADKFSLPTFTRDLAEWTHELVIADATGIFHACNSGEPVSWHGLAEETVRLLHQAGELDAVPPVASQRLEETSSFRAVRPRHTAMATTRLTELLGRPPRPWQEALADHLARR